MTNDKPKTKKLSKAQMEHLTALAMWRKDFNKKLLDTKDYVANYGGEMLFFEDFIAKLNKAIEDYPSIFKSAAVKNSAHRRNGYIYCWMTKLGCKSRATTPVAGIAYCDEHADPAREREAEREAAWQASKAMPGPVTLRDADLAPTTRLAKIAATIAATEDDETL